MDIMVIVFTFLVLYLVWRIRPANQTHLDWWKRKLAYVGEHWGELEDLPDNDEEIKEKIREFLVRGMSVREIKKYISNIIPPSYFYGDKYQAYVQRVENLICEVFRGNLKKGEEDVAI